MNNHEIETDLIHDPFGLTKGGVAQAQCSCGWAWEEPWSGSLVDTDNCSTISSADQLSAAVRDHMKVYS